MQRGGTPGALEAPLYSLSTTPPQPDDRRADERHSAVLRVGTLKTAGTSSLCLVKNISAGGLMARIFSPLTVEEKVRIGLKNQKELIGRVAWCREDHIGIAFDHPIDVHQALRDDALAANGRKSRMPRLAVSMSATVIQDHRRISGRTVDVSQGGAKVDLDKMIQDGPVSLVIAEYGPIPGAVRWQIGNMVGIAFNELLPLSRLLEIAGALDSES